MKIKFIGRTVQRLKKEFVTAQKLNADSTSLKAYGKIPGKADLAQPCAEEAKSFNYQFEWLKR